MADFIQLNFGERGKNPIWCRTRVTLGSAGAGVVVGNFGAANFSVDHTKPVNAIAGGLVFSNSADLINNLREQE